LALPLNWVEPPTEKKGERKMVKEKVVRTALSRGKEVQME